MSINKGESFRQKLIKITAKYGVTVRRTRDAHTDEYGIDFPDDSIELKVLDTGQISQRYKDINSNFSVGDSNQANIDMKVLIYPAPANALTTDYVIEPLVKENDEIMFGGYIHTVSKVDALAIQDVYIYFSISCTRTRRLVKGNE